MIPKEKIIFARKGISLHDANDLIWDNKISCLPILDEKDNLSSTGSINLQKQTLKKKKKCCS